MKLTESEVEALKNLVSTTYRIDRCYEDGRPRETQREGLTREEAMEHCQSPDTEGEGWFDAFYEE